MKKTVRRSVIAVAVAGILAVVIAVVYDDAQNSETDPQKMAQKITDFVVRNGVEEQLYKEGVLYEMRFYKEDVIYEIRIRKGDLNKYLGIAYYLTNRNFSKKRSAADNIADTLIWGVPSIWRELHLYDDGSDGTLDIFLELTKKPSPGVYDSFTREDRNLGKRAGIVEQLIHEGKTLGDNGWVEAPNEEKMRIQAEYEFHLKEVVKLIPFGSVYRIN